MTKSTGTPLDDGSLRARNLRTLGALAALFLLPLVASFWLYYGTAWRPAGRVNHGELISPPHPLPDVTLPRFGPAAAPGARLSPPEPALFRRKWTLVYVGDGRCDAACRQTLYVMRQTQLALGSDMARIAGVFLVSGNCCAPDSLPRRVQGLVVVDATGAQGARLLGEFPPGDRTHSLFIVDPLGNLMMRYDVRRSPGGLLVDLKKLLRLSQIG